MEMGESKKPRLKQNGSVFVKVLAAMGILVGGTHGGASPTQLPSFIQSLDDHRKLLFALIYLLNRSNPQDNTDPMTFHENRPESYVTELTRLLNAVLDGPVTWGGDTITVSATVAPNLHRQEGK